ncbi:MarP family serine protease [Corynebacterium kroppenstedtii]|uniref:MarP family serine protease n=1 Tax=Corynebacterium sp. PCR 32 TaxID=3351342 RepID=UPI0030A5E6FD
MSDSTIVDIAIVLIALSVMRSGWRQGGLSSIAAVIGVIIGGLVGLWAAPYAMARTDDNTMRFLLALGIAIFAVIIGYALGSSLGAALRNMIRTRAVYKADAAVGAVVQVFTAIVVIWMIALPVVSASKGNVSKTLRNSRVLGAVDSLAPPQVNNWGSRVGMFLNRNGMPTLTDPFGELPNKDVPAPADSVLSTERLNQIRPSIVQVLSTAQQCRKMLEGSGFVIAPDTVVTNAHVVAGSNEVKLRTVNGEDVATVTYFNPDKDIAVLHAVDLGLNPLALDNKPATTGADAVVLGYPLGGPFDVQNARIRDRLTIDGPNIYSTHRLQREAYTLRGLVREGNSGGPVVDGDGDVLGLIFGAGVDDRDTGYALTGREVMASLHSAAHAQSLRTPVDTKSCVAK